MNLENHNRKCTLADMTISPNGKDTNKFFRREK